MGGIFQEELEEEKEYAGFLEGGEGGWKEENDVPEVEDMIFQAVEDMCYDYGKARSPPLRKFRLNLLHGEDFRLWHVLKRFFGHV